jgi:hypothetical protein
VQVGQAPISNHTTSTPLHPRPALSYYSTSRADLFDSLHSTPCPTGCGGCRASVSQNGAMVLRKRNELGPLTRTPRNQHKLCLIVPSKPHRLIVSSVSCKQSIGGGQIAVPPQVMQKQTGTKTIHINRIGFASSSNLKSRFDRNQNGFSRIS